MSIHYELNQLWTDHNLKVHEVMIEEFKRDVEKNKSPYKIFYVEDYKDHWKIRVLEEETKQKENEIKLKYS